MKILIIIIFIALILFIILSFLYLKKESKYSQEIKNKYNNYRKEHVVDKEKENLFRMSSQERYGLSGEKSVAKMLESLLSYSECYIYNGIALKDYYGNTTEIDHIFISKGGIYVIETKNLVGTIYGSIDDEMWQQDKNGYFDTKDFKNPIIQNDKHIKFLKRLFGENPPKIKSVIIFLHANISNIEYKYIFNLKDAQNYLIDEINMGNHSPQYIQNMNNKIKQIINLYGITSKEHKDHILN